MPAQTRGLSERAKRLMRADLRELEPYDPAFSPTDVNLSANENTWPISDARREAFVKALAGVALNRYPDPLAQDLRSALARRHDVAPEQILVCNGADEGLFNLFLAFGGPGRRLLVAPPTFEEYENFAKILGMSVAKVWRSETDFAFETEPFLKEATKAHVVVLCSPNNPTGDVAGLEFTRAVHEASSGVVLVDEAYGEFADPKSSAIALLQRCPRLVVAKTFSKAFSFAGVRCGYLLGSADLISAIATVRQIYSVSAVTQALALASLDFLDEVTELVAAIVRERERLAMGLRALGQSYRLEVFPSEANFLLVRAPGAHRIRERLRNEESILVRDFSYARGLADCLRVSVGTPEENDRFLLGLQRILSRTE